nr:hypothetical protein [Tanacetum cinerariifolium]
MLVVARPKSTKEAWDIITDIVKDSKWSCTFALKAELRFIKLGALKMCLKSKELVLPVDSSPPMVLMAQSGFSLPGFPFLQGSSPQSAQAPPGFGYQPVQFGPLKASINVGQATLLPHTFTVETLHDPTTGRYGISVPALTKDHEGNMINTLHGYAVSSLMDTAYWLSEHVFTSIKYGLVIFQLRMTKVIKGEFEKLEDLNDEDVSLTCGTSLEVFNKEFNRMSEMGDDLFIYEVEIANIPCDSNKDDDSKQRVSHEADDDMGYGPSDVAFTECWKNDGYCNGGNLLGAYIVGNSLHYQDYEWYEALMDSELKEQALRNKSIMEGLISDDESSNDGWRRWEIHEITYHDHDEIEYENETYDERQELCETHELPVCNIRIFEMIKYSFGQDEEYVAVKEDEYDDLGRTNNDACRAY